MRKLFLLIQFFLISFSILGQKNGEFGIFAGASYYMGEVNPERHFYSTRPAFGALYKHNVNEHFSLRMGFTYGFLQGNDLDFNNTFQLSRAHSFEAVFIDLGFQAEFNFLPFTVKRFKKAATPYVTSGFAYTFLAGEATDLDGHPTIPFGIGAKIGWSQRFITAIEWSFRKTFVDNIDGLESAGQSHKRSFIHNNDWIFVTGIIITYKFHNPAGDCPVYWK
jgi:hypothetical protein